MGKYIVVGYWSSIFLHSNGDFLKLFWIKSQIFAFLSVQSAETRLLKIHIRQKVSAFGTRPKDAESSRQIWIIWKCKWQKDYRFCHLKCWEFDKKNGMSNSQHFKWQKLNAFDKTRSKDASPRAAAAPRPSSASAPFRPPVRQSVQIQRDEGIIQLEELGRCEKEVRALIGWWGGKEEA